MNTRSIATVVALGLALTACGSDNLDFPANEKTPHVIGSFQADSLNATKGQEGVLVFGPYITLAPGAYVATFQLQLSENSESASGSVDVLRMGRDNSHHQIAWATILSDPSIGEVNVAFAVRDRDVADKYEFRVIVNGSNSVRYKGVSIRRL